MTRIKTVLLGTALTVTAGAAMAGTPSPRRKTR